MPDTAVQRPPPVPSPGILPAISMGRLGYYDTLNTGSLTQAVDITLRQGGGHCLVLPPRQVALGDVAQLFAVVVRIKRA